MLAQVALSYDTGLLAVLNLSSVSTQTSFLPFSTLGCCRYLTSPVLFTTSKNK